MEFMTCGICSESYVIEEMPVGMPTCPSCERDMDPGVRLERAETLVEELYAGNLEYRDYVQHKLDCKAYIPEGEGEIPAKCTCGLDNLLNKQYGEGEE